MKPLKVQVGLSSKSQEWISYLSFAWSSLKPIMQGLAKDFNSTLGFLIKKKKHLLTNKDQMTL